MLSFRLVLVSVVAFFALFMSNLVWAATDTPLDLSQAKRYFDQPYSIFSRKWMYDSSTFDALEGLFDVEPKYDVRYRYEREYMSPDDGLVRGAVVVFGNYCVLNQGELVTEYQDKMFCLKDGRAFAHLAWESNWKVFFEHFKSTRKAKMGTKFVLLADVYANDAYRETIQYKPATRIIFSD